MKTLNKSLVPTRVLETLAVLRDNGFEAYLVGGCVRDMLLGREPKDWDITTNAKPEEIISLFEKTVYENLNSPGMEFRPLCPDHEHFKSCGISYDENTLDLYQILARVAGIAAQKEIIQLEANIK